MTLQQIKAMFHHGETWHAVNTWMESANGPRTVEKVMTTQIKWTRDGKAFWMNFPKAAQVIDAHDGTLSFRLFSDADFKAQEKYKIPQERIERQMAAVVTLTRAN